MTLRVEVMDKRLSLARTGIALLLAVMTELTYAQSPTVGPQIRIDTSALGSFTEVQETSAAASEANPLVAVAAWNRTNTGTIRVIVTTNGGATPADWANAQIPDLPLQWREDPMTVADPVTGNIWVGSYFIMDPNRPPTADSGVWVARWLGGTTFTPAVIVTPYMADADKPVLAVGQSPFVPGGRRLYMVYYANGAQPTAQHVFWSDSNGDAGTWNGPVTVPADGNGELVVDGSSPRVGPGGELYVVSADAGGGGLGFGVWLHRALTVDANGAPIFEPGLRVATRLDSWGYGPGEGPQIPADFRVPNRAYLAVSPNPAPNGTLYCVYMDTSRALCVDPGGECTAFDVDVYFTKSTDRGSTWSTPKVINSTDNVPYDQFFPWIDVDSADRLHVVYYDTRPIAHQDLGVATATLRTVYAFSTNGGVSWSERVLTTMPSPNVNWPTQSTNANGLYDLGFIGDYNGMAVTSTRVYPVYMATLDPDENLTSPNTDIYCNVITWP